jgi:SHS2 domain-containing protein
MFSLIGRVSFEERDLAERRLEIFYATCEEALQRWLQALLLEFDLRGFFPVTTSAEVHPGRITGVARGVTFDPARDELRSELKAVTQHGLRVLRTPQGSLEAEVIFDV